MTDAAIVEFIQDLRRRHAAKAGRTPYHPPGWTPFAPGPVCDPVVLAAYIEVWELRAAGEIREAA